MNLYDMTHGNYHMRRTVSYTEFPKSQIVFDTRVKAVSDTEWSTSIVISGTYDGPTNVVAVKEYHVTWTVDSTTIFEKGAATFELSSGDSVRSVWVSSISPDEPRFGKFSSGGETVNVEFSRFNISGSSMSYEWKGTVEATRHRESGALGN